MVYLWRIETGIKNPSSPGNTWHSPCPYKDKTVKNRHRMHVRRISRKQVGYSFGSRACAVHLIFPYIFTRFLRKFSCRSLDITEKASIKNLRWDFNFSCGIFELILNDLIQFYGHFWFFKTAYASQKIHRYWNFRWQFFLHILTAQLTRKSCVDMEGFVFLKKKKVSPSV